MFYKRLTTGMYGSNVYILGNEGKAVVIDCGADASEIMAVLEKENLKLEAVLLTHTHVDHVWSAQRLKEITGAAVCIHAADAPALTDARKNGSALFGLAHVFQNADRLLEDNEILEYAGIQIRVIHTPGHTSGGVCFLSEKGLFSGDTLFRGSVGRADLGDGDMNLLLAVISEKLMALPDETEVFPGHGTATTIGHERSQNPYL